MGRGSEAYDLSAYENAVRKEQQEPEKHIKVSHRPQEAASPVKIVFATLIAGAAMIGVVGSKVEQASVHAEIASVQAEVRELESENVRMETEIERKSALSSVEEYAVNILGMQKLDKAQVEHISLENGNVMEISNDSENVFLSLRRWFEDFVEYLRG